jgi:hypothetical protein
MIADENTKVLSENVMRIDHLRDRSVDGRIIFNWILRKNYVKVNLFYWLGLGTSSELS